MHSLKQKLIDEDRKLLLNLAHEAIAYGAHCGRKLVVDLTAYSAHLKEHGAVFVTLRQRGNLRGCIGSIAAYQPLVLDVADKAHCAAFQDPRFQGVNPAELAELAVQISMLTPLAPLEAEGEDEVLSLVRPGVDGLVIDDGSRKGTFLPTMWEQLPNKIDFWHHLKLKAGFSVHHWSDRMRVFRFETECFADPEYAPAPLG